MMDQFPQSSPAKIAVWLLLSLLFGTSSAITYTIPSSLPSNAAVLDPTPVGLSFEFFAFPSYFTNVTSTSQCLQNFKSLTGTWPPIRIGGTTQDRATYDASSPAYVSYTVASSTDAPDKLTFGPSFMKLAAMYAGSVVLGLNRGHNDIVNTIAAAKSAKSSMDNLLAIELGNEPEYYAGASQPITTGKTWNPAADAASQNTWIKQVGAALGTDHIIQAGNSNSAPPTWGAAELIPALDTAAKSYVATYAHHNYPGGSISSLMSHKNIASNMRQFDADVAAAMKAGREYVLGETNSVSGGGASGVSPTFGAALWTLDYILRASLTSIHRTYFHHGTVGKCYYCFFGRHSMGAPYYGAYAATAALAGGRYITALDDGGSAAAAYVVWDGDEKPLRAVLLNSEYYETGARGSATVTVAGLGAGGVRVKRLTAPSAGARQDQGDVITFGGQGFKDGSCVVQGTEVFEGVEVSNGQVSITVKASEAVVLWL